MCVCIYTYMYKAEKRKETQEFFCDVNNYYKVENKSLLPSLKNIQLLYAIIYQGQMNNNKNLMYN